jgi:hypothetical protein
VNALELAYEKGKSRSQVAIDFAQDYDVEKVWRDYWLPVLQGLLK